MGFWLTNPDSEANETAFRLHTGTNALDLYKEPRGSNSGRLTMGKMEEAAAPQTQAQQMFQGQRHPKKHKKISVLDQWVEVSVEDGKTVTKLFPSNEGLIERGQKMLPPPIYVYRRMNFLQHVPNEYRWVTNDPMRRANGGMCVQRMTVDTWLQVIEREMIRGDGHIGMTGVGNMPRPKERGGCSCPVCTKNAKFFPGV